MNLVNHGKTHGGWTQYLSMVLLSLAALVHVAAHGAQGSAAPAIECGTNTVSTSQGAVCGIFSDTPAESPARAFLGIPYAESTAGEARWTAPRPRQAWRETFKAVRFGPSCPQPTPYPLATPQSQAMDEDCLSLNVWTPADAKPGDRLPVMVFIHGGAFVVDSSANPLYDGAYLAATRRVVVVSLNYRLGALGFLATDELRGNYGFLDQQLALRWVQTNVAGFGGDPARVTIFGESAGAMSVGLHLFSAPQSEPLFRAGIMESNFLGVPYRTLAEAAPGGAIYKRGLGCADVACLRGKDVATLIEAQSLLPAQLATVFSGAQYFLSFGPVLDGAVLVRQPTRAAASRTSSKSFMAGTTRNEMYVFAEGPAPTSALEYAASTAGLFGPRFQQVMQRYPLAAQGPEALAWYQVQTDYFLGCATRHLASMAHAPAHVYLFDHHPSFPVWGQGAACTVPGRSCHGDELPFVFHTAARLGKQLTPQEERLSEAMMDYWTAFAATLDPNGKSVKGTGSELSTPWPAFARRKETLVIGATGARVQSDPLLQTCRFWDSFGYVLTDPWP